MCTSATDASVRNRLSFCQREAPPDRRKRWTPMRIGASGMMSRRTSVTAASMCASTGSSPTPLFELFPSLVKSLSGQLPPRTFDYEDRRQRHDEQAHERHRRQHARLDRVQPQAQSAPQPPLQRPRLCRTAGTCNGEYTACEDTVWCMFEMSCKFCLWHAAAQSDAAAAPAPQRPAEPRRQRLQHQRVARFRQVW